MPENSIPGRPVLKVCGATTPDDVDALAAGGADYVGLWHGVPGGHADLPVETVTALAGAARATGRLAPVLVTFLGDADVLRAVLRRTGIRHVQLHAYQPPALVKALRSGAPTDLRVIKVLHVRDGQCLERRFLGAYERAGTDALLLDTLTGDGRVGSTGQRLSYADVAALLPDLRLPFLLAGGVTADPGDQRPLIGHRRFLGIDVDSAARDGPARDGPARDGPARNGPAGDGSARTGSARLDPGRISDIVRGWGTRRLDEVSP
jgi:phosphoribosylanthranilate isomerase